MSLSIFRARQPNDLINIKLKLNFIVRQSYPIIALGTNVTQKDAFHYTINNSLSPGGTHYTRKEAELFAIEAAFEMLEERLTPIEFPNIVPPEYSENSIFPLPRVIFRMFDYTDVPEV